MELLIIAATAAFGAFLLCALLGFIHRKLDYRRADLLTVLSFIAFVAFCFLLDPLPRLIGKESLYVAFPGVAALLVFIGLKLDEKFRTPWAALILVPVLAAMLAPAIAMTAHVSDDSDYLPQRRPARAAGSLARAFARAQKLRHKR